MQKIAKFWDFVALHKFRKLSRKVAGSTECYMKGQDFNGVKRPKDLENILILNQESFAVEPSAIIINILEVVVR